VAIDDRSRISSTDVYPNESKQSAVQFLENCVRYFRSLGVRIERLLTDNGSAFRSKTFAAACVTLGVRHRFTRAYRPRTNGKAERFIQSALREWAENEKTVRGTVFSLPRSNATPRRIGPVLFSVLATSADVATPSEECQYPFFFRKMISELSNAPPVAKIAHSVGTQISHGELAPSVSSRARIAPTKSTTMLSAVVLRMNFGRTVTEM
jgi:transposase InsO family protein